ncbi:MAG TPA: phosphoribosylformylglycinamidine synthase subunit PurS [Actinomycetota bacterium]|nr:phosphoribosylformylglycinamidine synthase subunit PurS [Actinomycetota bacterium]
MTRRYQVFVHLKEGLADPQGKTIQEALPTLGYEGVSGVRVGKHIELTVEIDDPAKARAAVEEIAGRVLSNPVIEVFWIAEYAGGSGGSSSPGEGEALSGKASGPPGGEGEAE